MKKRTVFTIIAASVLLILCRCELIPPLTDLPVYTVSFDSTGGSLITQQLVLSNQLVTRPPDPVRTNYGFYGWSSLPTNYTAWDFVSNRVLSDLTLYAFWGHSVEIQALSNGIITADPVIALAGMPVRLDMTPTPDFQYKSGSLQLVPAVSYTYSNGSFVFTMPDSVLQVSAQFEAVTYRTLTVTVASPDYGTIQISPQKAKYTNGEPVRVTAAPASGYIFTNWTGTLNSVQAQLDLNINQNYTLQAHFIQTNVQPILPSPVVHPGTRYGAAMTFNADHSRVFLYGGSILTNLNDFWYYENSNSNWTRLYPAGSLPPMAQSRNISYVGNHKLILRNSDSTLTWEYDMTENRWTNFSTPAVPNYQSGSPLPMIYTGDDRVLAFTSSQVWEYRGSSRTWTQVSVTTAFPTPTRSFYAMSWDGGDRVLAFGGNQSGTCYNDLWAYSISTASWENITPAGTLPVLGLGVVQKTGPHSYFLLQRDYPWSLNRNSAWMYDSSAQSWIRMSMALPAVRYYHYNSVSTLGDQVVIFGGNNNTSGNVFFDDTLVFEF